MIREWPGSTDREPIYFNHIPKTAGTSVRHTLERVFETSGHNGYWFADDYLRDSRERLGSYRLLSGHLAMLPMAMSDRVYRMITFLREPQARSFSHFMHLQRQSISPWPKHLCETSYEEFLFSPVAEFELLSFQTRYLGMWNPADYFATKDRWFDRSLLRERFRSADLLRNAETTLEHAWFVGLVENYETALSQLSKKLGVPLDTGAFHNAAPSRSALPELSESARARLAWLTEFDEILYERARKKGCYAEMGSDEPLVPNPAYFKSHIDFRSGFVGGGWHTPEPRDDGTGYCWSSATRAWLGFLAPWRGSSVFCARLAAWVPEDLAELKVFANGVPIATDLSFARGEDSTSFMCMSAVVPADVVDSHGLVKIELESKRTICPRDFGEMDDRNLGVYVNWARLVPATGYLGL
ncbi:sulfotransferase family 2 domain-containing protein [Burkholderia diffusa]|uniref:sulfotransferase family 2 domain-containing protein n=1 Tax=Burkholderia diffusa TaxID=488732 RepID=UPI00075EA951|nr:sulfotransferase family 2 domain-containing protein [Burkholderia diffusa]KVM91097.1 hypothetical protein WJ62_02860 [Burkholderia diffusa]